MFDVDEIVEWLHYAGDGTNKSDCAGAKLMKNPPLWPNKTKKIYFQTKKGKKCAFGSIL